MSEHAQARREGTQKEAQGTQRPLRVARPVCIPPPMLPPPPPTHQDALTSSSSQSLRAWYWNRGRPPAPPRSRGATACACGPRGFGPASSSGPWPPRRRLASGGAGKEREVLILPVNLWYSEAMGRRALARWLESFGKKFPFSLSLFPLPTPSSRKERRGEKEAVGKEERRAWPLRATRESSRQGAERLCLVQLLRPLPGGAEARGRSDRFLFLLCLFFLSPCHSHIRPHQRDGRKARHQEHTKGVDMSRPHYLAPPRYQLIFWSSPHRVPCSSSFPFSAGYPAPAVAMAPGELQFQGTGGRC